MTADLEQLRRWLAIATGQQVAGDGVAERIWQAHEARWRLIDALPPLLDELEQLRGKTARPSLAELQARYLEVRQHTLSTDGLPMRDAIADQAEYVIDEARELREAIADSVRHGGVTDVSGRLLTSAELRAAVRHEIADVVLAATSLASMLPPGDVTVEACIAEKTEHDRGRG